MWTRVPVAPFHGKVRHVSVCHCLALIDTRTVHPEKTTRASWRRASSGSTNEGRGTGYGAVEDTRAAHAAFANRSSA